MRNIWYFLFLDQISCASEEKIALPAIKTISSFYVSIECLVRDCIKHKHPKTILISDYLKSESITIFLLLLCWRKDDCIKWYQWNGSENVASHRVSSLFFSYFFFFLINEWKISWGFIIEFFFGSILRNISEST